MGAEVSAAGRCDWPPPVEYAVAVDRYLAQASLSPASRRVYRISLAAWAWPLAGRLPPPGTARRGARPPVMPLAVLDDPDAADRLADGLVQRAERADARTVNRELSALRSALGWWLELGWITRDPAAGLRHPGAAPLADRAGMAALPALSDRQAAAVFGLPVGLREVALWRLLRDSGWATEAALALDADSVDLSGRRVRGADAAPCWRAETWEYLGWLLAGRPYGPVFLTDRRAPSGVAGGDVCPVTGRARMSYRRAAELFAAYTRPIDPSGRGYTLHQLRRPVPA
jgi:integrase/recombinase XerD